jgi:hypothetical protein
MSINNTALSKVVAVDTTKVLSSKTNTSHQNKRTLFT